MINQWIARLTTKQIVIYLMMIAVAIYIVWYVVEALEGLNPNYRPGMEQGHDRGVEKESFESFDPTKQKSTSLSTTLGILCELDPNLLIVSCSAKRTSIKSTLNWSESLGANVSNQEEFEFPISDSTKSEILITLEECLNTACNEVQTSIDVSIQSP